MNYPPFPWRMNMRGIMLQTVQLTNAAKAKALIPPDFDIFTPIPGKSVGGIYFAHYGPGSDLEYNELGVFPAMVKYGGKLGIWVSHMYVDNQASLEGGRNEMGMPKELAEFAQDANNPFHITVSQRGKLILSLTSGKQLYIKHQKMTFGAFGVRNSDIIWFKNIIDMGLGITGIKVEVPEKSPLKSLGLDRPIMGICGKDATCALGVDLQQVGETRG